MQQDFRSLIESCEAALRAGDLKKVASLLEEVRSSSVPRNLRLTLANFARRSGQISKGLKLLSPVIHPEKLNRAVSASPASAKETAEYAVLLLRNGNSKEALQMLRKLRSSEAPESLLYQAFCLFESWDHEQAALVIEDYLRLPLTEYEALVARVNLASAYSLLHRSNEAIDLLSKNISEAKKLGATRLLANSHELRAENYLHLSQMKKAEIDLDEANLIFGSQRARDQLHIRQWQAVIQSKKENSTAPLLQFRKEAAERGAPESVREADLYLLKQNYDRSRHLHLAFGTPYAHYQSRIANEIGAASVLEKTYLFGDGPLTLDMKMASITRGELCEELAPGGKIHQILNSLTQDFYRPLRLGTLFADLFPSEHFDIFSSPDRVHQLLRRTRLWIDENDLPISIVNRGNDYQIENHGGFAFLLERKREISSRESTELEIFRSHFGVDTSFTKQDLVHHTGVSKTKANELLLFALEAGLIEKSGQARATKYTWSKNSDQAA